MFLTNKTTIIAAKEGTPYDVAGETLTSTDFDIRIRNDVTYTLEMDEYRRKYLEGTLDHDLSVIGRQRGTFTFTVDMAPSATGSEDVPPPWSKLLQGCGFEEEIHATFGVSWRPHSDFTHIPLTVHVVEQLEGASADMLVTRYQGVMGNVTFVIGTVGEPVQMNFDFSGVLISMEDLAFASRLVPTALSTVKPGAILGSTVTVGGVAQDIDTFEFNMNNSIQEHIDPSRGTGIRGFYKDAYEPQLTLDPTLKQISAEPVYTEWLACTPGVISVITAPAQTGPIITLSAPAAQRIALDIGDRNGARLAGTNFLLTKGAPAGNDVFEILQGTKS